MSCYEALAGSYDALTEDVGYGKRLDFIEKLLCRSRIPVKLVLDLACGTGSLTLELARRGYEMIGVDQSEEMLAQAAEKTGARLVHVSTDYVFSGRENGGIPQDEATIPGPISAYGSTKLMGEKYVEQFCHRHFIVRTAWLYSYYGKNFVKTIVNAGKKFGKLEVVNDQCGNPTNAVDLAHEILQLCVTHEYGLYHCTGEGICSWYDFASEIIRLSGVDATVAPCTSEEYKAKHPDSADRPKWSALDNRMLRCTVGNDVRDWKDALACFFAHWDGENGMKG